MRALRGLVVLLLIVTLPAPALSQTFGCSVVPESWKTVQAALDTIFGFACTRHDLCYRTCNPPEGPYRGYWYKDFCDAVLLGDLAAACNGWSVNLSYPNSLWTSAQEFLDDCGYYAGIAYLGVAVFGTGAFLNGQCDHCNQWACTQIPRSFSPLLCEALCGWGSRDPNDCEQTPWGYDCPPCPIALDLQGNGLKLTGPKPPVYFDLDGDGTPNHTSWTRVQTKDGFLVWDRNQNGMIDDGRELFGTATPPMLSPVPLHHGFEMLAELDQPALGGNGDGVIDQNDRLFEHLQIWLDTNRDGVSQAGELKGLAEVGVVAIDLSYFRDDQEDQWGNVLRWWSPVYFEDGTSSLAVDVFFERLTD